MRLIVDYFIDKRGILLSSEDITNIFLGLACLTDRYSLIGISYRIYDRLSQIRYTYQNTIRKVL